VARTQDWDEFPNGRWGDSRSPAFGELDAYGVGLTGSNEQNRKKWGEPTSIKDIANLFVRYLNKEIEYLPWSEAPVAEEADLIRDDLIELNNRGLITVNSQPAVNGVKSTHPIHGWGPANGYVYQKAYLEMLISPELFPQIKSRIENHPDLTYHAVTKSGSLHTNAQSEGPNAVTWGVFPGKEIVQPTIVERISFLAWKDEAFQLGMEWARCYEAGTPSRTILDDVMNTWYLVNIVNNDFHRGETIFEVLKGLEAPCLDKVLEPHTNGATNGTHNGVEAST
jgi:methylenetetrahydrofolate reductase (NADPH)